MIKEKYFTTINNWENLTPETKKEIMAAFAKKLDAVGQFVSINAENKKSVLEIIQTAQSLANPKTVGLVASAEAWKKYADNRYGYIIDNILPYSNAGYSCYAVRASYPAAKNILLPPVLNFVPGTQICNHNEKTTPRFTKFVENVQSKLNIKIEVVPSLSKISVPYSVKKSMFKQTTITLFNDGSLNDFTAAAIISNLIAHIFVEENFKSFESKNSSLVKALTPTELTYFKTITEKLVTLGLVRATDLQNPEIAFKLDEALKLDFFSSLTLLSGKRYGTALKITEFAKEVIENVSQKLNYSQDKVVSNMKNMGFEYNKESTNIFEAIYLPNNLKKAFEIDLEKLIAEETAAEVAEEAKNKVKHVLGTAALNININKIKAKLRRVLPGLITENLLGKDAERYFENDGDFDNESIISFVLQENPRKYPKASGEYVIEIANEYPKMVKDLTNRTLDVVDELNGGVTMVKSMVPQGFNDSDAIQAAKKDAKLLRTADRKPERLLKIALTHTIFSKKRLTTLVQNELKETIVKPIVNENKPAKNNKKLENNHEQNA